MERPGLLQGNRRKLCALKSVFLFPYGVGVVTDSLKINEKDVIWQAFEIKVIHNTINSKPLFVVLLRRLVFCRSVAGNVKRELKHRSCQTLFFSRLISSKERACNFICPGKKDVITWKLSSIPLFYGGNVFPYLLINPMLWQSKTKLCPAFQNPSSLPNILFSKIRHFIGHC